MGSLPTSIAGPDPGRRSWLGRIDDAIYFFERGIVVVALFTLTAAYVFDVVSVEIVAADNAVDRLIYRLSGYGQFERPDEAFRERVHGLISPIVLVVSSFVLAAFAIWMQKGAAGWSLGRKLAYTLGAVAAAYGVTQIIAHVPSVWVCAATWLALVVAYGVRRYRQGALISYVIAWIPGTVAFIWLFSNVGEGYAWAQDLAKLLIMWIGFVGGSMATREGKHIQVDFVRKALSSERRRYYNALSYTLSILFCILLGVLAIAYLVHEFESGSALASIPIRGAWLVLPIALSLVVMVGRFAARTVLALQGREKGQGGPEIDGSAGGHA